MRWWTPAWSRILLARGLRNGGQDRLCAVAGEITTRAQINFDELARRVITEIGYDSSEKGLDGNVCGVLLAIAKQSGDIAMGVNQSMESKAGEISQADVETIGAGDQG